MAEDNQEESQSDKERGKGSSKLIIIIAIASVLLIGGGAAAFFLMKPSAEGEGGTENGAPLGKALFFELDPFVVSLTGERKSHYMQLELAILTRDQNMLTVLEENTPLVRNALIQNMNGMVYQDALLVDAPDRIRASALIKIRDVLKEQGGEMIEDVLIMNIVIQ
ncbi:flagellar basal body-associated FliL family protein [Sansalvadorimonas verongulae]|uniref:flagellar basal body-associated FliL family protein n=1 Tax=Sansalvadorimonas verongulae TaxID=2172824 RepID=UPI0012BC2706|nr:flagellar basal body-associated FliL family protein [Sansalvadorimonas verongulae]MTI13260.1 hypothetical protein [Sansalvadorimonas verongulae]